MIIRISQYFCNKHDRHGLTERIEAERKTVTTMKITQVLRRARSITGRARNKFDELCTTRTNLWKRTEISAIITRSNDVIWIGML
jgi:hypothetical protein